MVEQPAGAGETSAAATETRAGVIAAVASYVVWGFLPILFHLLDAAGPLTIVADRTIWSLLLVGAIVAISGRMGEVAAVLRDRRKLATLLLSALLLAANWLIYVYAVGQNKVLEASLGYFINPLVNVALGMLLLRERQNLWQGLSIGIAVIGIALQAVGIAGVPFIALTLALSFGFYGFVRKLVPVSSTAGLLVETLLLVPLALGYLVWSFVTVGPGPHADPALMTLLVLCGPATAVPLLLFAYAVRRLRLTTVGIFQYIAPSIQFVLAVLLFHESLNPLRLLSFGLIWLSLVIFSVDGLGRRAARPA